MWLTFNTLPSFSVTNGPDNTNICRWRQQKAKKWLTMVTFKTSPWSLSLCVSLSLHHFMSFSLSSSHPHPIIAQPHVGCSQDGTLMRRELIKFHLSASLRWDGRRHKRRSVNVPVCEGVSESSHCVGLHLQQLLTVWHTCNSYSSLYLILLNRSYPFAT